MDRLKKYFFILILVPLLGCNDPLVDIQNIPSDPGDLISTNHYRTIADIPTGISCMISLEEYDIIDAEIPSEAEIEDEILIQIEVELNEIIEGEAQYNQK
ncbi:MAG: hypothetical protein Roseis2KO_53100 [Roseivirga sp.]